MRQPSLPNELKHLAQEPFRPGVGAFVISRAGLAATLGAAALCLNGISGCFVKSNSADENEGADPNGGER